MGMMSAAAPNRWPDVLARTAALGMLVVPGFVLGVLVLDVLVIRWGFGRVIADGTWGTVFLPALTLALSSAAGWSRVQEHRSEEHTSELQSRFDLVCRLLLEKKNSTTYKEYRY